MSEILKMATLEQHKALIKEIKGVQRIVINSEHGGFSLSNEAVLRYLELCGIPVWNEIDESSLRDFIYWLVPPGDQRVKEKDWSTLTPHQRAAFNALYDQQVFNPRNIERDDPYLVKTVLELGDRSDGKYSKLKVVEIPGDVDWEIDEYDGKEWVAEKHRTWS